MKVRFPDGAGRVPTDCRATYRLDRAGPRSWACDAFTVTAMHWQEKPVLEIARDNRAVAYLEHMGEGLDYAGGAWPDGIATAFLARLDGGVLVLELRDVEASEPGPWHLSGIDGNGS